MYGDSRISEATFEGYLQQQGEHQLPLVGQNRQQLTGALGCKAYKLCGLGATQLP